MIFNGKGSLAPKQIIKQIFTRLLSILLHFYEQNVWNIVLGLKIPWHIMMRYSIMYAFFY